MAKKGERVGATGDSVYYRTPDGQIIDDSGNVLKGPMAKMLADEYESKQQEKAKAQAEAKAAADEAKRQAAAERAAETARKAAERKAAADEAKRRQAAERAAETARKAAERQAAADMKRQQAQAEREAAREAKAQAAPTPRAQAPRTQTQAPKQQQAQSAPAAETSKPSLFKVAMTNLGNQTFAKTFPNLSNLVKRPDVPPPVDDIGSGGSRQALTSIADNINTTNMMMQTYIARQEMTNQILGSTNQILGAILKEVQQIKKPSLLDSAADALNNLGGGGKAKTPGKVAPKSGILGGAGSVLRRAPLIGALLGGGIDAYDEYQESGNAGRAASTGVGAAAGGGLGAWGGATTGAALGAFGGPVGMAIGGLLGAAVGGIGGSWLGGKAGKGIYDSVATPSDGPQASISIKEAKATKIDSLSNQMPTDSVLNIKTLTFNAENILFNSKNQQGNIQANQTATNAGAPNTATGSGAASSAGGANQNNASGGDQTDQILATIRKRESGGNYQAQAKGSSASGAYQFIDGTWQSLTQKFGTGSEYKSAGLAPKEVQDSVARKYVESILKENNGDVSKVPLVWYTGNAQGKMSASAMAKNGGMTAQNYQSKWMNDFGASGGNTQVAGSPAVPSGGSGAMGGAQSFYVTPGQMAPPKVQPNQQLASLGNPVMPGSSNASAVQLAETMVGKSRGQSLDFLKAGGYNNRGEAWCAEFVNSSLKQTGGSGSGSAVANSFQNWGTSVDPSQVQAGDVVLQTRGKGAGQTGGHVGIATGQYRNGQVEMIAGNSGGQVRKYYVAANSQLMVRRGSGGTQMAGADKSKADQTVGGTPGAITPASGATSASLSPKETQALQTASLQQGGASKGSELGQASTKDLVDQRSAKSGITVNQQTTNVPGTNTTNDKNNSSNVGIVEPVDARTRLKELFGIMTA